MPFASVVNSGSSQVNAKSRIAVVMNCDLWPIAKFNLPVRTGRTTGCRVTSGEILIWRRRLRSTRPAYVFVVANFRIFYVFF